MACAKVRSKEVGRADGDEARLAEFESGVLRGLEQHKAGLVETFEDKDKFLSSLRSRRTP